MPCPLRCESAATRAAAAAASQNSGANAISPDSAVTVGTTLFGRGAELRTHLKENCPNMSVTCAKCDSEVAMRLKKSHDCVKALRGVITHYAKIISQQQEMIEKLTASGLEESSIADDASMSQTNVSTQF